LKVATQVGLCPGGADQAQGPLQGEEEAWPFDSDFRSQVAILGEGEYYPNTF
jgi:hypothetical protein